MSQRVPVRPQSRSTLKQNSRDVFKYMMTPDRIPEFIIPSLDILQEHRLFGKKGASGDPAPGPQVVVKDRRKGSDLPPRKDSTQPTSLPCCSSTEMGSQVEDIQDQFTWAALSLPHLPKITTPYGFVSLGESPHVTKEEAVFFRVDFASLGSPSTKRYSYPRVNQRYCDAGTPMLHVDVPSKDRCLQCASKASKPSLPRRGPSPVRSSCGLDLSELAATKDTDGASNSSSTSLAAVCPRSNSSPEFQRQKPQRNLFKKILKKHFAQHNSNFQASQNVPGQ
ncbi:UNVERIFIED_CONTAM: hypothetical protein K2H54_017942 [Gekko kuhli]